MINERNLIKSDKDNYTYIKFYWHHGGTTLMNKSTFLNYYPRYKGYSKKFEYLIENNSILKTENKVLNSKG